MNTFSPLEPADLSNWLSGIFVRELTAEAISCYRNGAGEVFLDVLTGCGPHSASANDAAGNSVREIKTMFRAAVEKFTAEPALVTSLAADFAALFLLPGSGSAPPYASCYAAEGDRLAGPPHDRMMARFAARGLAPSGVNEPADHLALMLEYLGLLQSNANANANGQETAAQFARTELLPWIGTFCDRIAASPARGGFYDAAARIVLLHVRATAMSDVRPV